MNKKVLTTLAAFMTFTVFFCTSCSKNADSSVLAESQDSEVTEATTTTNIQESTVQYSQIMGSVSGSTYTNTNSGLIITAPEGWSVLNSTEKSAFWNNDDNIRTANDELSFNDIAYESVFKADNGDYMSIMLLYVPGASEEDYSAVLGIDTFDSIRLGDKDVAVTYGSYDVDGSEIKTATVIDYNNNTMVVITVNCFTDEDLQSTLSNISFS